MFKTHHYFASLLFSIFLLTACSDDDPGDDDVPDPGNGELTLVNAFPNLTFEQPIFITSASEDSDQLYVVEQTGRIRSFQNSDAADESSVFLDITDRISRGNERGLLGLAFHPQYSTNRLYYVNYTDDEGSTIVAEYQASLSSNSTDPTTERILLNIPQPFDNHNAGMMAFGPDDYLYIATGDGGAAGDPENNSQDRTTLLGNVLRIDVDASGDYGIPSDNPYTGNTQGLREEIYAYGLRNPWRFSFDTETGELWLADVGQNEIEEVDVIVSGGNYGWNIMEGESCYNSTSCNQTDLILPVAQYRHNLGASITGGYVYRGEELSGLEGHYFYGDFVSGRIWSLDTEDPSAEPVVQFESSFNISSFGTDHNNKLYLVSYIAGEIFTLNRSSD